MLANRNPMKSGMVTESSATVNRYNRGAIHFQPAKQNPTSSGPTSSHGRPYVYDWPAKPTKLFVLAYVAKNEMPRAIPLIDRPPT